MQQSLARVTLVVDDYDKAIAFFTATMGFELVEDTPISSQNKRWVVVRPPGTVAGAEILLAKAKTPMQANAVGNQTGGRVFLFLETDDFQRDYLRLRSAGVAFCEEPRRELYGTVAVFEDLYGNRWDLVGRGG